jgi:UDP-N-acetylglucosamine:LPS N-acetylglucosamine transferase
MLFAISDTGGGHRAAASAISAAIEQQAGANAECHIVDFLTSSGVPLFRNAPDIYDRLSTRWLPLLDFFFQLSDGRRRMDVLTQIAYLQAHRHIVRVLDETRPKLVVSVHPLANRLIGNTRRQYRLSFRFITVVTDLVSLHAAWADPDAELCIVPTDEAFARLRKHGMPENKLVRSGFPVHPKFTAYTRTKLEARRALGLEPEPFTVLVTSGGVGAGNLRELVIELDRAYPQQQFLVVTGKNAALRQELQELNLGANVRLYGFVNNMEELMAASDVIVTKAGPGTLMEALVMRRPVLVTEAVGMQERGNIDLVLNHELGAFCPTIDRIIPAIGELMNPEVYAATTARLADAVPRDGATQIARILLEEIQLAPPRPQRRIRLPSMADIRQIGAQRLHRLSARRLRLPKLRIRSGPRRARPRLRFPGARRFAPWRRSRRG